MNRRFHDALEDRDEKAKKKISVLEDRITALSEHFETEKASILKQIEERGEELARMLKNFKVQRIILVQICTQSTANFIGRIRSR
jgi:hypothetical protein